MTLNKRDQIAIFLLVSISQYSYTGFWDFKFISNLWPKKEQESVSKDYTISPNSTIKVNNIQGNITVKAWNENKLVIEAVKIGTLDEIKNTSVAVQANSNSASITTKSLNNCLISTVNYTIIVPENSNVILNNYSKGFIKVKQVLGTIEVFTKEGPIEINDAVKTVVAKSSKGNIIVRQKNFSEPYSIFIEAIKGNVKLFVPRFTKANIELHTLSGILNSTHLVTISPQTFKLNKANWERFRRQATGTLGSGGAPITIEVSKGNIYLDEY